MGICDEELHCGSASHCPTQSPDCEGGKCKVGGGVSSCRQPSGEHYGEVGKDGMESWMFFFPCNFPHS